MLFQKWFLGFSWNHPARRAWRANGGLDPLFDTLFWLVSLVSGLSFLVLTTFIGLGRAETYVPIYAWFVSVGVLLATLITWTEARRKTERRFHEDIAVVAHLIEVKLEAICLMEWEGAKGLCRQKFGMKAADLGTPGAPPGLKSHLVSLQQVLKRFDIEVPPWGK